jgi:hypothetical protein
MRSARFLDRGAPEAAMPIHDWTRVDAGLFHDFHQGWTIALRNALNSGVLPADYFALVDQNISGPIPDVLTLQLSQGKSAPSEGEIGLAVMEPPRTRLMRRSEAALYADKANRITIRHRHGEVVAVVEIVSPGNKGSRADFRAFVEKSYGYIRQGVHLLVIDLFPPGPRDPKGMHQAIWDLIQDEDEGPPPDQPLTLASYESGPVRGAYVEFVAVGDALPEMPLFLKPGYYVPAPLEATYRTTWQVFPAALKGLLESPKPNEAAK